jgi:hypothetical protein
MRRRSMDVKYTPKGEKGRSCADCKHYEAEVSRQGLGKCFGREVVAAGSCAYFEPKGMAR